MSQLALTDSFEYICYGSTTIRNMFTLTVRGSTRRQILTSKVYSQTVMVIAICKKDSKMELQLQLFW